LGIGKDLPVYITETGWTSGRLTRETIAEYNRIAFENVWIPDDRVAAVTPFVFDYQSDPFLGFSWKIQGGDGFYPQYYSVQELEKTAGAPEIIEKGTVTHSLPQEFVADSSYRFDIELKNLGQAIWDKGSGYSLAFVTGENTPFEYFFSDIKGLGPLKGQETSLYVKTKNVAGRHFVKIALKKNEITVAEAESWCFTIVPLPTLEAGISLFPKFISSTEEMEIQLYDEKEGLVFKKNGIRAVNGKSVLENVQNIVIGKRYRLVALVPHYLPRQTYLSFGKGENKVVLKRFIPLDFNNDGALGWSDLPSLWSDPSLLLLFLP
jgi:hypothetical protein